MLELSVFLDSTVLQSHVVTCLSVRVSCDAFAQMDSHSPSECLTCNCLASSFLHLAVCLSAAASGTAPAHGAHPASRRTRALAPPRSRAPEGGARTESARAVQGRQPLVGSRQNAQVTATFPQPPTVPSASDDAADFGSNNSAFIILNAHNFFICFH